MRVGGIERAATITILVDGDAIAANEGETLAAALIAAGRLTFRTDTNGAPRGLYCNMGTCCECMVEIIAPGGNSRPARACLVDVADGVSVRTRGEGAR